LNEKVNSTNKDVTKITETAIDNKSGAISPTGSKQVKLRKKSPKNVDKTEHNDSEVVIDENVIDKSEKENSKISANIFGKKVSTRRSKERVRHDSSDSDVSLDWKDDPKDLDFDITESDEKAKGNKSDTTPKEEPDKKQRSIKDAFSAMFQKKTKSEEQKLDKIIETTENGKENKAKDENIDTIFATVNEEKEDIPDNEDLKDKQENILPEESNTNDNEGDKKEKVEVKNESDETKRLNALQVKDACLMKMLSALSAVADDIDENVEEEEPDFTPRTKKKKKKVFTPVLNPSNKSNSLVETPRTPNSINRVAVARRNCLEFEDKENEKEEIKEQIEAKNEYIVVCKGIEGKLYMDKFVSGGVGNCILYNGEFMPPNKFEIETGCRGKKYKQSLYINKKPMVYLLKALGLEGQTLKGSAPRTPGGGGGGRPRKDSRGDSSGRDTPTLSSGRATPCSSGRATPVNLPTVKEKESDHSVKQILKEKIETKDSAKKPRKKKQRIDSVENDTENQVETPALTDLDNDNDSENLSRRSGRIARNQDKIIEKKKEQEFIEKELEELERKENERKKKGRLVFPKILQPQTQEIINQTKEEQQCVQLGSSDEEASSEAEISDELDSDDEKPSKATAAAKKKQPPAKLASIFVSKKKPAEEPEKVAARRAFLMSSAPDQCRNQLSQAIVEELHSYDVVFPKVSHVQQRDATPLWNLTEQLKSHKIIPEQSLKISEGSFTGQFLEKCTPRQRLEEIQVEKLNPSQIRHCVANLKSESSTQSRHENKQGGVSTQECDVASYPINKLFRRILHSKLVSDSKEFKSEQNQQEQNKPLKKRKRRSKEVELEIEYRNDLISGEPWTNKYRPRCAEDLILNKDEAVKLRDWLSSWSQSKLNRGSQSSSATSDSEFDECSELMGTCALITGPPGNGKSAAVYGIAEELGLHVLEVNASSCRTGKQVTSMLLEATQSQQVASNQPKLNFFKPSAPTLNSSDSSNSKPSDKYRKALILFEDVDVVFEDLDTGFYAAVSKICAATKRPIIFTSSDHSAADILNKNIRARFTHFRFTESMNPELVSLNLHLMCLSEGYNISLSSLKTMIAGSICLRQSILTTQYLTISRCFQEKEDNCEIKPKEKKNKRKSAGKECITLSGDEDDSGYSKLLNNSSSSSRGSHRINEYEIPQTQHSGSSHTKVMAKLNNFFKIEAINRKNLFPLQNEEDIKQVTGYSTILQHNLLLNSDVFETDIDASGDQAVPHKEEEHEKKPIEARKKYTREEKKQMEGLSDYLDVHCNNVLLEQYGLTVDYEMIKEDSERRCWKSLDISNSDELSETDTIEAIGCPTDEQEILCHTLPCQILVTNSRMDTLAGLRNILRNEECRKQVCREGKRGGRFYHYLAKYGFNPAPSCLANVCNTFLHKVKTE